MKKSTRSDHAQRVNEILYQIHLNIARNYSVKELSSMVSMSPFHFNRVFKDIVGESLHTYIRRVRLEHSANALLFNPNSTVSEILAESGFSSNSSFTHAFKEYFGVTPTKWREIDRPQNISQSIKNLATLHVEICMLEKKRVIYVRHKGYDRSIKDAWMKLICFCDSVGLKFDRMQMIGLHHSNPNIVKKEECHYVACLEIKEEIYPNSQVGVMDIPKIFCAKFSLKGEYGNLMRYMDYIYYIWLPNSPYEKVHLPSLAYYRKNHFLREDSKFELDFYVPIRYQE